MEDKIKQFLKTIKLNEQMLSMLFGVVTVVLVGILVFRMYGANKPEITDVGVVDEQVEMVGEVKVMKGENGEKIPTDLPEKYTVQAGDHLWAIAEKHYGSGYNWTDIASANELTNASVITEDQELKLPKVAVIELETQDEVMAMEEVSDKIEGDSYTVVAGDKLWDISVRAYSDGYKWSEIASANEIVNGNLIEVGQVINLVR